MVSGSARRSPISMIVEVSVSFFDERWDWHDAPLVFSYMFTPRPNKVKGWGMHMKHEDRYFVLFGEMEVIMYDTREDSLTKGLLSRVNLSEWERRLMCIPIGV